MWRPQSGAEEGKTQDWLFPSLEVQRILHLWELDRELLRRTLLVAYPRPNPNLTLLLPLLVPTSLPPSKEK